MIGYDFGFCLHSSFCVFPHLHLLFLFAAFCYSFLHHVDIFLFCCCFRQHINLQFNNFCAFIFATKLLFDIFYKTNTDKSLSFTFNFNETKKEKKWWKQLLFSDELNMNFVCKSFHVLVFIQFHDIHRRRSEQVHRKYEQICLLWKFPNLFFCLKSCQCFYYIIQNKEN